MNLQQLLELTATRSPNAPAIVAGNDVTTYRDLLTQALRIAPALEAVGVKPGDRVVTVMANSPLHAIVVVGLSIGGLAAVPVNPRAAGGEVATIIEDCGASCVIYEEPETRGAIRAMLANDCVAWVAAGDGRPGDPEIAALLGEAEHDANHDIAEDEIACFLYTSGTTGRPKGLANTHRHVVARVRGWLLQFGPSASEPLRALGISPLHHITGLHCALWSGIAQGGSWHVTDDRSPEAVLALIQRERLTYLLGVPVLFERWVEAARAGSFDLSSINLAVMGSAPRPPQLVDDIRSVMPNARVAEAYGNTEGVMLGSVDLISLPGAFRSAGDLVTRIIRPGGHPDDVMPEGEEGELIASLSSERVVGEYWRNPEATAEKFKDGWAYTGDGFISRSDGTLWVSGRLDDMFISGGENIQPGEIEAVLRGHGAVRDVAVLGVPDPKWGQIRAAFVVCDDPKVDADELDRFCRESPLLSNFKRPRTFVFIDTVPRNAIGKIVRASLREQFQVDIEGAR